MSREPGRPLDPDLLLEASRVMNAAGRDYAGATRFVSDLALQNLKDATPPIRAAILGDAAALRLRTPGNYEDALKQLQEIDTPTCPDGDGRLRMLRALANGQKYAALKRRNLSAKTSEEMTSEDEFTKLKQQIREDLYIASQRDTTILHDNKGYWGLSTTEEVDLAEDDLREVYIDDDEFKRLVTLPPEKRTER